MLEVAGGILIAIAVLLAAPPLFLLIARISPRLAVVLAALVGVAALAVALFLGAVLLIVGLGAGAVAYLIFRYRQGRVQTAQRRDRDPESIDWGQRGAPRPRPPVIDQ